MILMVSVQNLKEAIEAHQGGADIVDVKNLQEALVGSGHPKLVAEIRSKIPDEKHVSVTLGVVPNQAGTVAMAVYSAAALNATSVKVGFMKTDYDMAVDILLQSKEALKGSETKLIGSLFADNPLYDGLEANRMVQLAKDGKCDGFLIDTLTKDGRNLFDFFTEDQLKEIIFQGKELGMSTAISGHLRMEDVDELARINPDIIGVRGAVCASGDRNEGVARKSVAIFKGELDKRMSGEVSVFDVSPSSATNSFDNGWVFIDGRGMSCAGIIAQMNTKIESSEVSVLEIILPDLLSVYDLIVWAEKGNHRILTRKEDPDGLPRILIEPSHS
jgi:hypothetical protein